MINSDLAINRGDRAIAVGLLRLVRERWPHAAITIVSEEPERDRTWYGADVLAQGIHSLSPLDLVRLLREARAADLVLWGGGEMLKDYTNRLGLRYWGLKMGCVARVNRRVFGVFQGVGPTYAPSSRRSIARTVRRTSGFITRDAASRDKLLDWGVPPGTVAASYDCAVVATAADASDAARAASPADDYAVIAPRRWFHYAPGGVIPHRWRRAGSDDGGAVALADATAAIIDELARTHTRVLVMPMHMGEDPVYARELAARCDKRSAVTVLDADDLSPARLEEVIAGARLMVAQRLHAGIIATAAGVPTITYHYVDKGRLFTEQALTTAAARPIGRLLEDDFLDDFRAMHATVVGDAVASERTQSAVARMREDVRSVFAGIEVGVRG